MPFLVLVGFVTDDDDGNTWSCVDIEFLTARREWWREKKKTIINNLAIDSSPHSLAVCVPPLSDDDDGRGGVGRRDKVHTFPTRTSSSCLLKCISFFPASPPFPVVGCGFCDKGGTSSIGGAGWRDGEPRKEERVWISQDVVVNPQRDEENLEEEEEEPSNSVLLTLEIYCARIIHPSPLTHCVSYQLCKSHVFLLCHCGWFTYAKS